MAESFSNAASGGESIRKQPTDDLSENVGKMNLNDKSNTNEIGARSRRAQSDNNMRKDKSSEGRSETINYDAQRMVGHGSFGAVFQARVVETGDIVAIKKVLQDRRFKNRELQIMRQLSHQTHPYIVTLKHYFVSKGSKADEVYLNLVLEYIPETVYSVAKMFARSKETMPLMSIKIYMYQLARALAHIHGMGICHRDIKPQNLLVDPSRQVLKLCDFGSAKALVAGEPNVAYICSRYYRAPELIFGSTEYTTAIDVWSGGCVLAELLLGSPLFPGSSGVDQLVEVIKILGTPTKEQLLEMNPNYQEFKFPHIRATPWTSVFKPSTPPQALDLVSKYLQYIPKDRYLAIESCTHPFFDELRDPSTTIMLSPSAGGPSARSPIAPEMFEWTTEELALKPEIETSLTPPHIREKKSN